MMCKHCHKQISYHNFAMGPGWSHDDSTLEGYTYCKIYAATPVEP